jgi:hypothetical protein
LHVEELETRDLLAPIPVSFVVPAGVASQGVYAAVTANTNLNTSSTSPATWGYVPSLAATTYSPTTGLTQLPLLTIYPPTPSSPPVAPVTVYIPDTPAISGQIVIFIGSDPPLPVDSSTGAITSPTSTTFPTNVFGLFEYSLTNGQLDIDNSEVDQVGFPFTITTNPAGSPPAQNGVGITPNRQDLFNDFTTYVTAQNASPFEESLTNGNGYRLLAPQNVVNSVEGQPTLGAPTISAGGSLTIGMTYYYAVTATNASGETMGSNVQNATPYNLSQNGMNFPQQTISFTWQAYPNASGYRLYRSTSPQMSGAVLIGTFNATALSFTDTGVAGTSATIPANNYTFDPLNSYFNSALDQFFTHYQTNTFSLNRDGYTFTGNTDPSFNINGNNYTVLRLTATSGLTGQEFWIIEPYFSSNTNIANAPPPPSWLLNASQSPGGMVLANDGVFNTGNEQPSVDAGVLSDIENSIVTAFNRGIANNFSIAPSNWIFAEPLNSATATTGGNLATGTYYYVITGVNSQGETSVSNEESATVSNGTNAVQLSWNPQDSSIYTQYNVYRGASTGAEKLLATVTNNNTNPTTGYLDTGSSTPTTAPPVIFYAPGSLSNWYAGYLHQTNVSIGGLAYGFGYDDQGGFSTNFVISNPQSVTITVQSFTSGSQTSLGRNPAYVTNLYLDILKRAPDLSSPTDAAGWVNGLNAGRLRPADVDSSVVRSPEANTILVRSLYLRILGRPATGDEGAGWVQMLNGGATQEQVIAGILASPEFGTRAGKLVGTPNGDANTNFVQALYLVVLGRQGSNAEVNGWLSSLNSLGRSGVAAGFLRSAEFRTLLVEQEYGFPLAAPTSLASLYVNFLGRKSAPTTAEVNSWVNSSRDLAAIEAGFAGSDEFYMKS